MIDLKQMLERKTFRAYNEGKHPLFIYADSVVYTDVKATFLIGGTWMIASIYECRKIEVFEKDEWREIKKGDQ